MAHDDPAEDTVPVPGGQQPRARACHNPAMPAAWALTPPYFLVIGFLCGVTGFRVGWRSGNRVALPALEGFFGWGAFLLAWTIVGAGWAAATVGCWVAGTTLAGTYVFVRHPREADARVIRAVAYRGSMLDWLESGRGPEARPLATAVAHLRELVWYLAAAVLTANLGALVMGAILLGYMNAYVATLFRAATRTGTVALLAWNVWSLARVAAYVAIGAAGSAPLLRMWGLSGGGGAVRPLAIAGAAGVVADLVLKLALSRPCGRALARAVDLEAARAGRSSVEPLHLGLS